MIVAVSGRAYYAALDPHITGVPAEIGLPEPSMHKWGRGHEFRYEVTVEQAEEMEDHLLTLGQSLAHGASNQEDRDEGRLVLLAARRIRRALNRS